MVSMNFKWLKRTVRIFEGKEPLKQAIVVRADVKMSSGKLAAQVAHASVAGFYGMERRFAELAKVWVEEGMKKIVLKVDSLQRLNQVEKTAKGMGLLTSKISDAGYTEVPAGTVTCLAIGPDTESKINKVIGSLPLLK